MTDKTKVQKSLDEFFDKNTLPKALESDDDAIESLNIEGVYSVAEELGMDVEDVLEIYNEYYNAGLEI